MMVVEKPRVSSSTSEVQKLRRRIALLKATQWGADCDTNISTKEELRSVVGAILRETEVQLTTIRAQLPPGAKLGQTAEEVRLMNIRLAIRTFISSYL